MLLESKANPNAKDRTGKTPLTLAAERGKADVLAMGLITDGLQGLFSHTDARWQTLRNWGMNAVGANPFIKSWLTRQAMG